MSLNRREPGFVAPLGNPARHSARLSGSSKYWRRFSNLNWRSPIFGSSFVGSHSAIFRASGFLLPYLIVPVLAILSFPAHALAKKRTPARTSVDSATVDQDYIAALATANRFLHARQSHDPETGILLLSDGVKTHISEDYLSTLFSSDSQTAYEISRGKKLESGRYCFPVTLFEVSSVTEQKWTHPRSSQIVVLKSGKDDWTIDKLPWTLGWRNSILFFDTLRRLTALEAHRSRFAFLRLTVENRLFPESPFHEKNP